METFSALLTFLRWIHRSPVNSPYKGQCRGALIFSLIFFAVAIKPWQLLYNEICTPKSKDCDKSCRNDITIRFSSYIYIYIYISGCRHKLLQCYMILVTIMQWLQQNIYQQAYIVITVLHCIQDKSTGLPSPVAGSYRIATNEFVFAGVSNWLNTHMLDAFSV